MKKFYAVSNLLVIFLVIYWNYLSATEGINGRTVGNLSEEYNNLFTPAAYAFSIWSLIFLALVAHGIFLVRRAFGPNIPDEIITRIGLPLLIANMANMLWTWVWLSEYTGVSILVMLTILGVLLYIVERLKINQKEVNTPIKLWVWIPISLYSGWIAVATIANVSAYLAKIGWSAVFSEAIWAAIMMIVAVGMNLWMIRFRNMRVFAGVGVWALVAIAVRHWGSVPLLQWTALTGALILIGGICMLRFRPKSFI